MSSFLFRLIAGTLFRLFLWVYSCIEGTILQAYKEEHKKGALMLYVDLYCSDVWLQV